MSKLNPIDGAPSLIGQPPDATPHEKVKLTHDQSVSELKQAIHDSEEIIVQKDTVFPLSLFPDTIVIDRGKITFIKREFFWNSETVSFRGEDTLNVVCVLGPFLGHLKITGRIINEQQEVNIGPFWRSDATRLKCIVQGYILATQNGTDTTQLSTEELCDILERLGHDSYD